MIPVARGEGRGSDRAHALAVLLVLAGLVALAWSNRFLQDDAFISFRYAQHLAGGQGLVWNPGEHVEGYTDFLWTVLVAGAMALGQDPVRFALAAGLIAFAVSLVAADRLASALTGSRWLALAATALLGTNYSFSCFATGGLETSLQAALLTLAACLALSPAREGRWAGGRAWALSLVAAAATLTRPDSLAVVVPLLAYALAGAWASAPSRGARLRRAAVLVAPVVAVVGAWTGWRVSFYGALLPNTFYAKVSLAPALRQGLRYASLFYTSYFLLATPVLFFLDWRAIRRALDARLAVLALVLVLWIAYVVVVGGDFMEFRFFVPVLPLGFALLAWLVARGSRGRIPGAAAAALLLVSSLVSAERPRITGSVESIRQLSGHLRYQSQNWGGIGRTLGATFQPRDSVVLAVTAAGAIPYYSGLPTVDMLGLSDAWVARHGAAFSGRSGHRRIATLAYLERRSVNPVIGHPLMEDSTGRAARAFTPDSATRFRIRAEDVSALPAGCRVIAIPIAHGYDLLALYLTPSPAVDRAIRERGWPVYGIRREGRATR